MKTDIKRFWQMLTQQEKRRSVVMLVLVVLMAFAETVGVVSIMPFLSVPARPEIIQENEFLTWAFQQFSFDDTKSFITALGVVSIALVVGSSVFKTITLHLVNRFTFLLRHSISSCTGQVQVDTFN